MRIVVNHLTRMSGTRICVAGVDEITERHVRPVTPPGDPITRSLCEEEGGPFGLGAIVELGDVQPCPSRPESEDHRFSTDAAVRAGRLAADEYLQLLDRVSHSDLNSIFGPALERRGRSYAVVEGNGSISLGVLQPQQRTDLAVDGWGKLRLEFNDDDEPAQLGVTDLRFVEADHHTLRRDRIDDVRARMQAGVRTILMVGLARAFRAAGDDQNRHWLQVNGICLADRPFE